MKFPDGKRDSTELEIEKNLQKKLQNISYLMIMRLANKFYVVRLDQIFSPTPFI